MMTPEERLETLIRSSWADPTGAFRPFALFDASLDCIRVVIRDCSATEVRVNERITILEDQYYSPARGRKYVGFTIKGAKHFCHEQGLSLDYPIRLTEILDRIVAMFPDLAVRLAVNAIARPMVEETPGVEKIDLSGRDRSPVLAEA